MTKQEAIEKIKTKLANARRIRHSSIKEWNQIKTDKNYESRSLEDNETYMLGQIYAYETALNLLEEAQ